MVINDILMHPLFKKVFDLGFQPSTYAIFGSGPLFAHNITSEINDVDILVNNDGWQKALVLGQLDHTSSGDPVVHVGDDIEIFKIWAPGTWDVQNLIDQAEIIDGLAFVKLDSVLAWKKLRGKPKDKKHIELIELYLKK